MDKKNYTTFNNLPATKQDVILQVALLEFSKQGYAKASCNRIVKQAAISKGSLFQYFGSKEGLYTFICQRFLRKIKDVVKHSVTPQDDCFGLIRGVLYSGAQFIDRYPEYFQIYLKIVFDQDAPFRNEFLSKVQLFSSAYFGEAIEGAMQRGTIRSDLPIEMLLFSIDACLDRFFLSYASHNHCGIDLPHTDEEHLRTTIHALVAVLEGGLKNKSSG